NSSQSVDVKVTDQHGSVFDLGPVSFKANQDFGPVCLIGSAGETIKSVELTAANGFKEVKQIEVGFRAPVPVPRALVLAAIGLSALGGWVAWRRVGPIATVG